MIFEKTRAALAEIKRAAMEHPAFDEAIYKSNDMKAAGQEGGDTCDWVCIAWNADIALAEIEKEPCQTCGGTGVVDDVIHSVNAGIDIYKSCPDCQKEKQPDKCTWTYDNNYVWETSCGNVFCLTHGTPADNNMKFCSYCGKEIKEKP